MKITKKIVLAIVSGAIASIFVLGLYLNYGSIKGTDVALQNGECKRFMELEKHFESHDELYDTFQAGEVDCTVRQGSFLNSFLEIYRTEAYECSIVEAQLRYPNPDDYLAAMDAGTDKCVGDTTGEYVATLIRNAPP